LISDYGEVKLTDFGIASLLEGTSTQTTSVSATIEHAAPEILAGEQPTPAADVYSLGSTLFTFSVGRSAYRHETDSSIIPILNRIATEPLPDPRDHGVPQALAAVIEAAMAKRVADRIQTAAELADRLAAL